MENELVLRQRCGKAEFGFPHICLVGPPGSGKTRFASRMNALAEVPYLEHSAAGSSDARTMVGTSRGWGTGMPALATSAVARFDAANCSLCIDDISWTALRGQNGSIQDALLTFLEPETSRRYFDEYLQTEVDLSRVSWCVTTNSLGQVSSALRSRLLIIEIEPPRPEDFDAILCGIVSDLESEFSGRLPVALSAIDTSILRQAFQDHRSIRVLKRQVRWLIGIKVSELTLH
ncbi:MAG: AAA family ATPase [Rhodobacteraceae bacterium]|nr:AAA family ATPase [Paracoccaceae bacterium]